MKKGNVNVLWDFAAEPPRREEAKCYSVLAGKRKPPNRRGRSVGLETRSPESRTHPHSCACRVEGKVRLVGWALPVWACGPKLLQKNSMSRGGFGELLSNTGKQHSSTTEQCLSMQSSALHEVCVTSVCFAKLFFASSPSWVELMWGFSSNTYDSATKNYPGYKGGTHDVWSYR